MGDGNNGSSAAKGFGINDVVAGISVAALLIPQSLAYGSLAGMPAYRGLYAAMLPPIVAAFFASSPYLQTGPVAITSLLTFGALAPLAAVGSSEFVLLAALLALVVGITRVTLGLVRGGWVSYLMSQPVVIGFTNAAAILIIASQLPSALGTQAGSGSLMSNALWAVTHPGQWGVAALVLSLLTIGLILGGTRITQLFPAVLIAVVAGVVFSTVSGYSGRIVGEIPAGLPPFSVAFPWGSLPALIVPGIVIALVGFAEPAAIARTLAARERQMWSPDQELVSQGAANLAAAISGGFPVGGSFSRTALNHLSGGRTRWSGAVTGVAILMFLPVAGILSPLPTAILGAIVISAVLKLIRFGPMVTLVRHSVLQAGVAWTTFVATLAMAPRIERGVLVGVGLAVLVHLWRELRLDVQVTVDEAGVTLKPTGVLYFGSAPGLNETLFGVLAAHPEENRVTIDLSLVARIDYTGALALKDAAEWADNAGFRLRIRGVPPPARTNVIKVFGPGSPFLEDS